MLRVTPQTIHGKVNHLTGDCATGFDSTSGGTFDGSVVDRLAMGRSFTHAQPFIVGSGLSNTSTGGIKHVKLDVLLKHGDSSGGGDLAEVDTGLRVVQQPVYNTGLTTDEKVWTTGTVRVQHSGVPYALQGLKRWIAPSAIVTRAGVTTATGSGNDLNVSLGVNLLQADESPPVRKALVPGGEDVLYTTATDT